MSLLRCLGVVLAWLVCSQVSAQGVVPSRRHQQESTPARTVSAASIEANLSPEQARQARVLAAQRDYVRELGTERFGPALTLGLSAAALMTGGVLFRFAWKDTCFDCDALDYNATLDASGLALMGVGATSTIVSGVLLVTRARRHRQEKALSRKLRLLAGQSANRAPGMSEAGSERLVLEARRDYLRGLGTEWRWAAVTGGLSSALLLTGMAVNIFAWGSTSDCEGCGDGFDPDRARRGALMMVAGGAGVLGSACVIAARALRFKRARKLDDAIERTTGQLTFAPPIPNTGFRGGLRYHLTF